MNVDEDRKIESDFENCFRILYACMFSELYMGALSNLK